MRTTSKMVFMSLAVVTVLTASQVQAATEFAMPAIPGFRASAPKTSPRFALTVPVQVPAQLGVLKLAPVHTDATSVAQLADRLGLRGEALEENPGRWLVEDVKGERRSLTVFGASGGTNFMNLDQLHIAPENTPKLPSDAEAYTHALGFLKERDLLPADFDTRLGTVTFHRPRLIERDMKRNVNQTVIETAVQVRFRQYWQGLRVSGPGSKLYVMLGEGNVIEGLTRMARTATGVDMLLPAVSAAAALDALGQGEGTYAVPTGCTTAKVTKMEVVYWSDSPRLAQDRSVPVYEIGGDCVDAQGKSLGEFFAYAPAAYAVPGFEPPQGEPRREGPPWPREKR
ncbi:MAG TPA: hypothetical protein VI542_28570 [Candidatus Tectomicrobia bacterium]